MVHDGYNAVSIYLNFSRRVVALRLVDVSAENIHDFKDSLQSAALLNASLFVLRVKYLQPQKIRRSETHSCGFSVILLDKYQSIFSHKISKSAGGADLRKGLD
ncbi:hypothetical protein ALC56_03058 [Trachymyrmex septentrionalis]|uniref:Uncharacterized protein n=1 Tax=Trachymyrmex septentrionalis TaxID=34720 RepID=A0A195FQE7_9HYME|nr:hypothetical protein ALC56_03058 [Trachymyrmex septentrionalis]